jgi:hypothetical protein
LGGLILLLTSITDPVGSGVVPNCNDLDLDAGGEVAEVHEPVGAGGPGTERYLAFSYRQEFNIIDPVELARGRGRLWSVQLRGGKGAIASSVTFDYDSFGRLVTATRDVRAERYACAESEQRHARNNLAVYTDPNGHQTQYEYFKRTDTFPGIAAYEYLGYERDRKKDGAAIGLVDGGNRGVARFFPFPVPLRCRGGGKRETGKHRNPSTSGVLTTLRARDVTPARPANGW